MFHRRHPTFFVSLETINPEFHALGTSGFNFDKYLITLLPSSHLTSTCPVQLCHFYITVFFFNEPIPFRPYNLPPHAYFHPLLTQYRIPLKAQKARALGLAPQGASRL